MIVRELRVRYAVPEMFHPNDRSRDVIHAIICNFPMIKSYVDDIKKAGYRIVGFDYRMREESKRMSQFDGWSELKLEERAI